MIRHAKEIKRVLFLELGANVIVAIAKLVYGILTGTLSMIADGIHSFTDAGSSIVGIVSVHMANQPSDEDHHYGHHKYETIAALGIGALIGLTAWEIFKNAISRLLKPPEPDFFVWGLVLMLFGMGFSALISWWERKKGEEYNSPVLKADAYHTASDVWVSLSVLVSLVAIKVGFFWVDPLVSLGIAVYLTFIAFRLVRENVLVLSDAAFINSEEIEKLVLSEPRVISCHQIRTRGRPGHAFIDFHIQIDPDTDTATSHRIVHNIEDRIRARLPGVHDVIVHTEPYPDTDPH